MAAIERFAARLAHRPDGMPVHDVMREWLLSEDEHQQGPTRALVPPRADDDSDCARLRETAIVSDPDPARTGRAAMDEFDVAFEFMRTRLLADAI